MLYSNEKHTIVFDSGLAVSRAWLDADPLRAERVLSKHSAERAKCSCTPSGVPMHIVARSSGHYLASLPARASHHALNCAWYREDPAIDIFSAYDDNVVSRANKRLCLRVAKNKTDIKQMKALSPDALLQVSWKYAALNICTPKTIKSRNPRLVHLQLSSLASHLSINNNSAQLYIPGQTGVDGATHLIGQIHSVNKSQYSVRVALRYDTQHSYWITPSCWKESSLIDRLGPVDHLLKPSRIFIMARIFISPKGYICLDDPGTLLVDSNFLPCDTNFPLDVSSYIAQRRRFVIHPRLDRPDYAHIPRLTFIDQNEPQHAYI